MTAYKATFLGTGTSQGIPVISCDCSTCKSNDPKDKRLRASLMFSIDDKNVVIDTGPDFRQQMLTNDVRMVEAILFTHEHKDHVSGMDDIRAYNYRAKKPMDVYASPLVEEALRREYHYVFQENTHAGIPQVKLHEITDEPIQLLGEEIIPINVLHYRLPVKAFRLRGFTYITDASYISDEELDKIIGSDIIVINALRREKHISHFNLEEALALIEKINPKKAFLTHISHLLGPQEVVSRELPENVFIAYDGLQIEFE